MKKLLMLGFSAVMLSICGVAQAQDADTASANYHYQRGLEETGEDIEEGAEKAGNKIEQGAEATESKLENAGDEIQQGTNNATDDVDQSMDRAGEEIEEGAEATGAAAKEGAEKVEEKAERAADKTEDKLDDLSTTGAAHIKDEVLESKEGPNGETIFINEHAQHYYVNDQGDKVMVQKSDLKDKQGK